MSSYCEYAKGHPYHGPYHDTEYGFPIESDNLLFGRLVLEMNQAGLSWLTILKKKDSFQKAFSDFDVSTVANYGEADINLLVNDASIIRNRLKINAAIHNAQQIIKLAEEYGSFYQWLCHNHPKPKSEWVKLFKKQFKFTGGEITGEFLISTSFLPGAHHENCPIYKIILDLKPKWLET